MTISQHRVINDISGDMGETLEKVSPISPAKAIKRDAYSRQTERADNKNRLCMSLPRISKR